MLKASKHEAHPKIRSPRRDVGDDDVDRRQVEARRRVRSRAVLISRELSCEGKPAVPPAHRGVRREAKVPERGVKRVRRVCGPTPWHNALGTGRGGKNRTKEFKAATARGIHLYPSRTEKLSPAAPMVLRKRESRSPPHRGKARTASNRRPGLSRFCPPPVHGTKPAHARGGMSAWNFIKELCIEPFQAGKACVLQKKFFLFRIQKTWKSKSDFLNPFVIKLGLAGFFRRFLSSNIVYGCCAQGTKWYNIFSFD